MPSDIKDVLFMQIDGIWKSLVYLMVYQLFMGHLMRKFDAYGNALL